MCNSVCNMQIFHRGLKVAAAFGYLIALCVVVQTHFVSPAQSDHVTNKGIRMQKFIALQFKQTELMQGARNIVDGANTFKAQINIYNKGWERNGIYQKEDGFDNGHTKVQTGMNFTVMMNGSVAVGAVCKVQELDTVRFIFHDRWVRVWELAISKYSSHCCLDRFHN